MVAMVSDNNQTIEITVVGLAYWADQAVSWRNCCEPQPKGRVVSSLTHPVAAANS